MRMELGGFQILDEMSLTMPNTDAGKAVAARNATTHGLFSRDVVLPALGEDPEGYKQLEAAWLAQLPPKTLLERHYVEKIAAASWRLRRLHRWQAQILEEAGLTEDERLDKLTKVLRHETTLHRQIDTAVRMLSKDAPQLYAQQAKDLALDQTQTTPREYAANEEDGVNVELKAQDRLRRIRMDTEAVSLTLAGAPLDPQAPAQAEVGEICENELPPASEQPTESADDESADEAGDADAGNCQNELKAILKNPFRLTEYLDPKPRVFKLQGRRHVK